MKNTKECFRKKDIILKKMEDKLFLHRVIGKKMSIFFVKYQKGWHLKRIKHINEEFLYILKGRLKAVVGKRTYILKKDDSLLISQNDFHTLTALETTSAVVIFSPARTEKSANALLKKLRKKQ